MRPLQRPAAKLPSCTDDQDPVVFVNCLPVYEPERNWLVGPSNGSPPTLIPELEQLNHSLLRKPEDGWIFGSSFEYGPQTPAIDIEELNRLLLCNPERKQRIKSREPTPDVWQTRPRRSPLEYFRNRALEAESDLRDLGASEEYRISIPSVETVEYWKTESDRLLREYDILLYRIRQQGQRKRKERNQKASSRVTKDRHLSDGPISSRLRSRQPLRSRVSSLRSATANRPQQQSKKNGTQRAKSG